MEILTEIVTEFTQKTLELSLSDGLSEFLQSAWGNVTDFIHKLVKEKVRQLDEVIFQDQERKRKYAVVKKGVSREVETRFGPLEFERRYYKKKKFSEEPYRYLVDDILGLCPYERVERELGAELCRLATDHSYAKSSHLACDSRLSKQTVMQLTRRIKEDPESSKPKPIDHKPIYLHLQCDEDHVSMQDGTTHFAKICVIHEPRVKVKGHKKRYALPEKYVVIEDSVHQSNEAYWFKILDAIEEKYGLLEDLTIYIHGDGASWIKAGLEIIPGSRFVLDRYHFSRYLSRVASKQENIKDQLWTYVAEDNFKGLKHLAEAMAESGYCSEDSANNLVQYYRNNRSGIRIWYEDKNSGRSCAEGLVSHHLSRRLSTSPLGWGERGLESILRLRVHLINGGTLKGDDLIPEKRQLPLSKKLADRIVKTAKARERDFLPSYSDALKSVKPKTPLYYLFDRNKYGGYRI